MMKRMITFLVLLVLVLSTYGTAFAQEESGVPACEGDNIAGTVVAVDEESGLITVDPDLEVPGDECTVFLTGDFGHPITTLLGSYFGEVNIEDLTEALETTQVCAIQDEVTEIWTYTEPDEEGDCAEGEEEVTVTGQNEDGSFSANRSDGTSISLNVEDEETSGALSDALENLNADWDLNEDGSVADVGDDIAQYHEDGFGFGVIVKVYAFIAELEEACLEEETETVEGEEALEGEEADDDLCGKTVEDLFNDLANGSSIGDLFETYGKPSIVGIGHVRNGDGSGEGDGGGNGICNARSKGGKANASGRGGINCGTTIPNKDRDKGDKPEGGDPDPDEGD
ncbi:MAG: hypothetical protein E3J88_03115 [Anaerolineales bacterium]|nr:MAG: hypothetical protein E3J88_03115 [Anaerolineales bacterium]